MIIEHFCLLKIISSSRQQQNWVSNTFNTNRCHQSYWFNNATRKSINRKYSAFIICKEISKKLIYILLLVEFKTSSYRYIRRNHKIIDTFYNNIFYNPTANKETHLLFCRNSDLDSHSCRISQVE